MNSAELLRSDFLSKKKELELKHKHHKSEIEQRYGSLKAFREGLSYWTIDKSEHLDFKRVYALYETFFPLPEERESFEGFEKTMSFNDSKYQTLFGPFKEEWLLVNDDKGELIGGANFAYYGVVADGETIKQTFVSSHIMYIFVKEEYRLLGIASLLLEQMSQRIEQWADNQLSLANREGMFFTCEQNAPELMSVDEYFTDAKYSLTDPCDRLLWWHRRGYKRLAVNYIQPALDAHSKPCKSLTLNIKADMNTIPGSWLIAHIQRYFTLSIQKGVVTHDNYFNRLQKFLSKNDVSTQSDEEYYLKLKDIFYADTICHQSKKSLFPNP